MICVETSHALEGERREILGIISTNTDDLVVDLQDHAVETPEIERRAASGNPVNAPAVDPGRESDVDRLNLAPGDPPSKQRYSSVAECQESIVIAHGQMSKAQSQKGHQARSRHETDAGSRNSGDTQCKTGQEG